MVTHAACGSDHTALLTLDGGVFTFGAGNYGQLGHGGGKNNEQNPKKVLELMGTEVSQVQPTYENVAMFVILSVGLCLDFVRQSPHFGICPDERDRKGSRSLVRLRAQRLRSTWLKKDNERVHATSHPFRVGGERYNGDRWSTKL